MAESLPNQVVRVMIVDDHRMLTELLSAALSERNDVVVVGTAANAADALPMVKALRPTS